MGKIPSFIKIEKNQAIFVGDGEFRFYIPEKQIELNFVKIIGDFYSLEGINSYSITDKNGKTGKLKRFNYPTRFLTSPSEVEKIRNVKLISTSDPQDYRILKYRNGDVLIDSIKVPEEIENVEQLTQLFVITGNIPNTIPYDKLPQVIVDNMAYNGGSYGINMQMFGLLIGELCRDPKDVDKPFRLSSSISNMHAYKSISIKEVSKLVSPYAAISSENFDDCAIHAILATDAGKEPGSPLEGILMNQE